MVIKMVELDSILSHFGVHSKGFQKTTQGMVNQTFIVDANPKCVIRVIDDENLSRLTFEVQFMNFLRENGVSVPRILKTIKDEWFHTENGKSYVLMEFIEGPHPVYNQAECDLVAQSIARMHLASRNFILEFKGEFNARDLFDFGYDHTVIKDCVPTFLEKYPQYKQRVKEISELLEKSENYLKKVNLPTTGLIHNDLGKENLLISNNAVFFIDFDFMCHGHYISDLTAAVYSAVVTQKSIEPIEWFLESYSKIKPLSVIEKNVLPYLLVHQHTINVYFMIKRVVKEGKAGGLEGLEDIFQHNDLIRRLVNFKSE